MISFFEGLIQFYQFILFSIFLLFIFLFGFFMEFKSSDIIKGNKQSQ